MAANFGNPTINGFFFDDTSDPGFLHYRTNDAHDYFENFAFRTSSGVRQTNAFIQSEGEKDLSRPPLTINRETLSGTADEIKARFYQIFTTLLNDDLQRKLKNVYYNISSQTHGNKLFSSLRVLLGNDYIPFQNSQFDRLRRLTLKNDGIMDFSEWYEFIIKPVSDLGKIVGVITIDLTLHIEPTRDSYKGTVDFRLSGSGQFPKLYNDYVRGLLNPIITQFDAVLLKLSDRIDTPFVSGMFSTKTAANMKDVRYIRILKGISDRVIAMALLRKQMRKPLPWALNALIDFLSQFITQDPGFHTRVTNPSILYIVIMEDLLRFLNNDSFVRYKKLAENSTKLGKGYFKIRQTLGEANTFKQLFGWKDRDIVEFNPPTDARSADNNVEAILRSGEIFNRSAPNVGRAAAATGTATGTAAAAATGTATEPVSRASAIHPNNEVVLRLDAPRNHLVPSGATNEFNFARTFGPNHAFYGQNEGNARRRKTRKNTQRKN